MAKDMIKQKVTAFFKGKLPVHVILSGDSWLNGTILNMDDRDYFTLEDFKVGETPVFFAQIIDIKKFKARREDV